MASTPAILSGGGGIDLSVGPLATLVNCIFVTWLLPHGFGGAVSVPVVLAIGAGVGAINGVLVAVLRYQPVIATLCVFFILAGLAEKIAPNPTPAPQTGRPTSPATSPSCQARCSRSPSRYSCGWRFGARRSIALLSVGGDDAAAFSAGVDVARFGSPPTRSAACSPRPGVLR